MQTKRAELVLHRDDLLAQALDRFRAPQRLGRALAQPEPLDLPRLDILAQRLEHELDWHGRVDAVLVVEVDVVGLQALERAFEGVFDVGRLGDGCERRGELGFWVPGAEFRREEDVGAAARGGEPAAEDLFG